MKVCRFAAPQCWDPWSSFILLSFKEFSFRQINVRECHSDTVFYLIHTCIFELNKWMGAEKKKITPVWRDHHLFVYSLLKPQIISKDICPTLWTPKGLINNSTNTALKAEPHHTNLIIQKRTHAETSILPSSFLCATEWGNIKMDNKSGLCSAKKCEGKQSKGKCPGIKRLPVMNNTFVSLKLKSGNDNEINNELIAMHVTGSWDDPNVLLEAWSLLAFQA